MIYFDNNATTLIHPQVAEAMISALQSGYMNPSSPHQLGRRARQVLEQSRETIAELLGAHTRGMDADRVIFTSGGTEANNLALLGLVTNPPGNFITSAIEHPSVLAAAEELVRRGFQWRSLPVDKDGVALRDRLPELLDDQTRLVSVMLGNNETGVLQPVGELAALCAERGIPFHTDAVQAVGKIPVRFRDLAVTALSCTAHKLHGPRGMGALVLRRGSLPAPILHGGFQQDGLRPGTEDVALAVGFRVALEVSQQDPTRATRLAELRDAFERALLAGCPEAVVLGHSADRLPHTSNIAFPGLDRQALLIALDLAGVACSTGSACASGSSQPSPVLLAMGCSEAVVAGSLRFSFSALTTADEVHQGVDRILKVVNDLRRQNRGGKLSPTSRQWP